MPRITPISPFDYGAVGDTVGPGTGTDDTAAILAWWSAMLAEKRPGVLDGMFRFKPVNPLSMPTDHFGLTVRGVLRHGSGFFLDDGFRLRFEGLSFYSTFAGFRIGGLYNGPLVTFGKDDFTDAHNNLALRELVINNWKQHSSNEGIRLNYVCASVLDQVTINCGGSGNPQYPTAPGFGTALVLRQTVFTQFNVALGNAKVGLHLAAGWNYSNDFLAADIEEVNTCLKIDSTEAKCNRFSSGTLVGKKLFEQTVGGSWPAAERNVVEPTLRRNFYTGGVLGSTTGMTLR